MQVTEGKNIHVFGTKAAKDQLKTILATAAHNHGHQRAASWTLFHSTTTTEEQQIRHLVTNPKDNRLGLVNVLAFQKAEVLAEESFFKSLSLPKIPVGSQPEFIVVITDSTAEDAIDLAALLSKISSALGYPITSDRVFLNGKDEQARALIHRLFPAPTATPAPAPAATSASTTAAAPVTETELFSLEQYKSALADYLNIQIMSGRLKGTSKAAKLGEQLARTHAAADLEEIKTIINDTRREASVHREWSLYWLFGMPTTCRSDLDKIFDPKTNQLKSATPVDEILHISKPSPTAASV